LVEIDLRALREPWPELHLEEDVIEAGSRMEHEHRPPLPHPGPVRHELGTVDVDVEASCRRRGSAQGYTTDARYPETRNWNGKG